MKMMMEILWLMNQLKEVKIVKVNQRKKKLAKILLKTKKIEIESIIMKFKFKYLIIIIFSIFFYLHSFFFYKVKYIVYIKLLFYYYA